MIEELGIKQASFMSWDKILNDSLILCEMYFDVKDALDSEVNIFK